MKYGTMQPLRTTTVILNLSEGLLPKSEAFEWLDQYTASSFALLGYLICDALLAAKVDRPQPDELARAFWNLYEEAQVGLLVPGEVPDRIVEMIDAACVYTLQQVDVLHQQLFERRPFPSGTTACLLPFHGYDLAVQLTCPTRL